MESHASLASLPERQLLHRFGDLVRQDRRCTAEILAAIAEIDERKIWAKHACPSMFSFCVERFQMSESMTAKRIWAARTARRFPVILRMIARGELHLSGIVRLARHLTEDNHLRLLERARHKSSRQIDLVIAEVAPQPDAPPRIRALPRTAGSGGRSQLGLEDTRAPQGSEHASASYASTASSTSSASSASNAASGPPARKQVVALAPRRYKIEITVDQETHDKLRMLEDLLSHDCAAPDPAVIVSRAIDRLLDDTLKKKAALTDRARPGGKSGDRHESLPVPRRTRAIPAAIRREVWKRDGGCCTFADHRGRRCRATRGVEYHHETPYGKGGGHEAGNIALRCQAHNQYEADLDFGRGFMDGKRRGSRPHSPGNGRCPLGGPS